MYRYIHTPFIPPEISGIRAAEMVSDPKQGFTSLAGRASDVARPVTWPGKVKITVLLLHMLHLLYCIYIYLHMCITII